MIASDISKDALEVAKINAKNNDTEIDFIESDLFDNIDKKFDIIVSNPPYIKTEVIKDLSLEVQNEPHLALDGGEDGLNFYRIIAENAYKYLKKNGVLAIEIGYDQKEDVMSLLEETEKYTDITAADVEECLEDIKYLEENGLKNSLEYSICSEIFQRPLAKHYPLATSLALCEMAMTDEFVRTNGFESLNQEYIEYVLRNIKAAKITDYDIISKYEGRFRDIISPKKGMLDYIAKLVKVPKRGTNKD